VVLFYGLGGIAWLASNRRFEIAAPATGPQEENGFRGRLTFPRELVGLRFPSPNRCVADDRLTDVPHQWGASFGVIQQENLVRMPFVQLPSDSE